MKGLSVQLLLQCKCCLCRVSVICVQLLAVAILSVHLLPQCKCCLCRVSVVCVPVVGSGYFKCSVVTTV